MAKFTADLTLDDVGAGFVGVGGAAIFAVGVGRSPAIATVLAAGRVVGVVPAAGVLPLVAGWRAMTRSTAATTCGHVCGRFDAAGVYSLEEGHPLIEVAHLSKQIIEGDHGGAGIECGHQGLVFHVQSSKDIGDKLFIWNQLAGCSEFVNKGPHLGEVGRHRLVPPLCIGQRNADVVDAGQRVRREHVRKRRPKLVGLGDRCHLHEHLFRLVIQ